jgi:cytochrome b561
VCLMFKTGLKLNLIAAQFNWTQLFYLFFLYVRIRQIIACTGIIILLLCVLKIIIRFYLRSSDLTHYTSPISHLFLYAVLYSLDFLT